MEVTDQLIFKVAIVTTLIGIIGMLVFASSIEPKEIEIKEITRNNIGEIVSVTGVVESVKMSSSGKSCFLELNDGTSKINVIVFESTLVELEDVGNDLNDFKNHKVKITGSITEYNSAMELILQNANSIKLIY
ncbi:OB-fold nucleic acid binding domain-containing protein [uncultured Methanobrevibacter sp.]|uniref:OB-fold nucleic acid binding domain-containing protein n=1 Tax=uncultured Methanobrevibacter sp. TaxID=253161 RepID=UPI0026045422